MDEHGRDQHVAQPVPREHCQPHAVMRLAYLRGINFAAA
jgi:hypothetical protein